MTPTRIVLCAVALVPALAGAQALTAPDSVAIGAEVKVGLTAPYAPRDFVSIVAPGAPEGKYNSYQYASSPTVTLTAPDLPGTYEIRLLAADSPYATRARRPLTVRDVPASLEAPDAVEAGADFQVKWSGPGNPRDYIAWVEADAGEKAYRQYQYISSGNPVKLRAPDAAGAYELRYFTGAGDRIIARRALTVGSVAATLEVPATAAAGAEVRVNWTGPGNKGDFITLVKQGTPEKQYAGYSYTASGNPVTLRAPDLPGAYEVRYATGQSYTTLARAPLAVAAVTASIKGPATVVAGTEFKVSWQGPGNAQDYLAVAAAGSAAGQYVAWVYVGSGNPAPVRAPLAPGAYELRYVTGQSDLTLASAPLAVTPAAQKPGRLALAGAAAAGAGPAVEVVLDASGSMLQKMGGRRRIDIAKDTLGKLVRETLPDGTPFALRVFGKEVDSCRTDLEIPLKSLDRAAAAARVQAIEARNNARTAIGASLLAAAGDLGAAQGERLIVLITDGEETCGGDPPAAIAKLKAAGVPVTLNIVGFAIDDGALRSAFRRWAETGAGAYFDGSDAAGLDKAVSAAVRPRFAVQDAAGAVVARGFLGGEPVSLPAGAYTVRTGGRTLKAEVRPDETTTLDTAAGP